MATQSDSELQGTSDVIKSLTEAKAKRYQKLKQERRLMRVLVDLDLVGSMFVEGVRKSYKVEGLPQDSLFVGASQAVEYYGINFFYLHESFEPVPSGGVVPQAYVVITAVTDLELNDLDTKKKGNSKPPKEDMNTSKSLDWKWVSANGKVHVHCADVLEIAGQL